MSDYVIDIKDLSKKYRLGEISSKTLSGDISLLWNKFFGKEKYDIDNNLESNVKNEIIWALENINLQINKGDIVGVIGKNGAGKSTLLKILSRITSPTKGQVKLKGRVASLLEVGTGFHKELTGFENIYLNGAILGMNKKEINSKLDEIIDFSGIEKYIHTPVKRYSSGMRVRLAFSVAAHLIADILLVDEVLAVGDLEFQQKSIGYLNSKEYNKTVLFVSHRLMHIEQLTHRTILLDKGKILMDGKTDKVIEYYKNIYIGSNPSAFNQTEKDYSNLSLDKLNTGNVKSEKNVPINKGEKFTIEVDFTIHEQLINNMSLLLTIESSGKQIIGCETKETNIDVGVYKVIFKIDDLKFNWGEYYISVYFKSKGYTLCYYRDAQRFSIKNITNKNLLNYGGLLINQIDYNLSKIK